MRGLGVRVAMIVMKVNQDCIEQTREFVRSELGTDRFSYDFVRPAGRGCNDDLAPDDLALHDKSDHPSFSKCPLSRFQRARFGHNCFSYNVCVTATGSVLPCIMERDHVYGNVLEDPLADILERPSALVIRRITKDSIEICRDCEYRYACFDCRVKSKVGENFLAKPASCTYNPVKGFWS